MALKTTAAKATKIAAAAAIKASMEARIVTAARKLAAAAPSIASSKGKTYETWVMFEIAVHLKDHFAVAPLDCTGKRVRTFRVRGGPGFIRPRTGNPTVEPCYFAIGINRRPPQLELHNSIEHVGGSGGTHELDISIVYTYRADVCRSQSNGAPYQGAFVMGAELKAYDEGVILDKSIPRAVLGAAIDLAPSTLLRGVSLNLRGQQDPVGGWYFRTPKIALVTTAGITPESKKMLASYSIAAWGDVGPTRDEKPLLELAQCVTMRGW